MTKLRSPVYLCWLYREPKEISFITEGTPLGAQGLSSSRLSAHKSNDAIRRIIKMEINFITILYPVYIQLQNAIPSKQLA